MVDHLRTLLRQHQVDLTKKLKKHRAAMGNGGSSAYTLKATSGRFNQKAARLKKHFLTAALNSSSSYCW